MERQFIVLLALLYTTIVVLSLANPQDVVGDTTTADTPAASTDGNGKDLAEKLLSDPSAGNATINGTEAMQKKEDIISDGASQAVEKKDSLAIFFILLVIVLAILLVHLLIKYKLNYIPESLSIVLLGALIGFILSNTRWDWTDVEKLKPNFFFLVLLPPIIFESGYNLHKGNFFANIVPILLFSIIGTVISSAVMACFLLILGKLHIIYDLGAVNCFVFGSMVSAVDPVITLAIFQALKVDVQLYMLAFGESMLNDAVAIVLATTAQSLSAPSIANMDTIDMLQFAVMRFLVMFFASSALGMAIGLISALVFKHIDFRRTPSLELALLLIFAYIPYGLAEAISLSGIMAILACAITMSQYTHFNISPITQITFQQTFQTISFVAETCTFAYLGLALFTIPLTFYPGFFIVSIILLFVSRAANVFPLSYLVNKFLRVKISMKNQIIMWFSGMRGAVALALALYMEREEDAKETQEIILTATLLIVLFTIVFMGGTALPLIKILSDIFPEEPSSKIIRRKKRRTSRRSSSAPRPGSSNGGGTTTSPGNGQITRGSRRSSPVLMSKTQERVIFDNSDRFTECETDDGQKRQTMPARKNILTAINENIIRPFFVRKFTQQEKREDNQKLRHIAITAMKNSATPANGSTPGNESSEDEEVFFQSCSTLNTLGSTGNRPLLPV